MNCNLALGTAQFGRNYGIANTVGKVSYEEIKEILIFAHNSGIRTLDTSDDYGDSESTIGMASKEIGKTFEVILKIYFANECDVSEQSVREKIELAAERVAPNSIRSVLIHNPNLLTNNIIDIIKECVSAKVGVSAGTAEHLGGVISKCCVDAVEIPVNLINQTFEKRGILKDLKKSGVEIYARSVFLQGLLLMPEIKIDKYFNKLKPILRNIAVMADSVGVPVSCLALEYPKSLGVDKIIVGVDCLEQMQQLVSAYNTKIDSTVDWSYFSVEEEKFINPGCWPLGGWK